MLSEGYTKSEIRAVFIDMYGYDVLISPPFSGFFSLAWTLPFVALIGAGYFLKKYIEQNLVKDNASNKKKRKKQTAAKKGIATNGVEDNEEDNEKIEKEMKKYL